MSRLDLERIGHAIRGCDPFGVVGRVERAVGLVVEATLPSAAVGTSCEIRTVRGASLWAEVVGFQGARALLMPYGETHDLREGCAVIPRQSAGEVAVGQELLGRVVDASCRAVDGGPEPLVRERALVSAAPPPAMTRKRIAAQLPTGVRALDACLTIGEGQRVGIMAGPGVGKSVLMGMLARAAAVDVIVVGLVGERGREVREFVERDLGEGLKRAVVVVATADEPPLMRVRAAMTATAIAEHFRARGKRVLLLIDSLSRVAMAQREVGLAAGEPPTSKGYPPSVFALLPRLLERAGLDRGTGSITGFYTVLAEGDDLSDPVADASRAALDGHLVLSRKLAEAGHFPAIDVLASVSRVMTDVAPPDQVELARQLREVLATYREAADLIEIGAYVAGSSARIDRALKLLPGIQTFLRQAPAERSAPIESVAGLRRAMATTASGGAA